MLDPNAPRSFMKVAITVDDNPTWETESINISLKYFTFSQVIDINRTLPRRYEFKRVVENGKMMNLYLKPQNDNRREDEYVLRLKMGDRHRVSQTLRTIKKRFPDVIVNKPKRYLPRALLTAKNEATA